MLWVQQTHSTFSASCRVKSKFIRLCRYWVDTHRETSDTCLNRCLRTLGLLETRLLHILSLPETNKTKAASVPFFCTADTCLTCWAGAAPQDGAAGGEQGRLPGGGRATPLGGDKLHHCIPNCPGLHFP